MPLSDIDKIVEIQMNLCGNTTAQIPFIHQLNEKAKFWDPKDTRLVDTSPTLDIEECINACASGIVGQGARELCFAPCKQAPFGAGPGGIDNTKNWPYSGKELSKCIPNTCGAQPAIEGTGCASDALIKWAIATLYWYYDKQIHETGDYVGPGNGIQLIQQSHLLAAMAPSFNGLFQPLPADLAKELGITDTSVIQPSSANVASNMIDQQANVHPSDHATVSQTPTSAVALSQQAQASTDQIPWVPLIVAIVIIILLAR